MLYNLERPHTFDAVVGQKEIVKNIRNQSIRDKFFQVYILGGQFGSGKTTMSRITAMAVNCQHKDENGNPCCECESCKQILSGNAMDVIEMDAASNTGVDNIRDLKDTVGFYPSTLKKKVYIIDEVHMLSNGAFNALLKVLEEPPEYVVFILCTTEVKKIPTTVRSRAAMYVFGQIGEDEMTEHLKKVAERHHMEYDDAGIQLISKNADGAMRNALSILEQVSILGKVTEKSVATMLGITDPKYLFDLAKALLRADRATAIDTVNVLMDSGKEPFLMISDLLDICADCVLASYDASDVVNGTQSYRAMIEELCVDASADMFSSLADGLMDIRAELAKLPGRTTIICGIIRMLSEKGSAVSLLSAQIKVLEDKIAKLSIGEPAVLQTDTHADVVSETKEDKTSFELITPSGNTLNGFESVTETKEIPFMEEDAYGQACEPEQSDKSDDETDEHMEVSQEETVKEDLTVKEEPAQEKEEVDMFAAFSSFMFQSDESEDSNENEVEESKEEIAEECTIPDEPQEPTSNDVMESREVPNDPASEQMSVEEVHEYIEKLCATDSNGPFLQNVLSVPCEEKLEDGKVVFVTSQPSVFKILETYEETMGPFPFNYRVER